MTFVYVHNVFFIFLPSYSFFSPPISVTVFSIPKSRKYSSTFMSFCFSSVCLSVWFLFLSFSLYVCYPMNLIRDIYSSMSENLFTGAWVSHQRIKFWRKCFSHSPSLFSVPQQRTGCPWDLEVSILHWSLSSLLPSSYSFYTCLHTVPWSL